MAEGRRHASLQGSDKSFRLYERIDRRLRSGNEHAVARIARLPRFAEHARLSPEQRWLLYGTARHQAWLPIRLCLERSDQFLLLRDAGGVPQRRARLG